MAVGAARLDHLDLQVEVPAVPARGLLAAERFARQAARRRGWSARRVHRVLQVARTIADLAGRDGIAVANVAAAMRHRRGLAVP